MILLVSLQFAKHRSVPRVSDYFVVNVMSWLGKIKNLGIVGWICATSIL
jgi:hypothetical protein